MNWSWVLHAVVMGLVVAVISRTVTQEEIFVGLRNWAKARRTAAGRKIAYPLTCQYCFSHWVAAGLLIATGDANSVLEFFVTVFVLVGLANALLIGYETATVSVKVKRSAMEFNQKQSELSEHLIVERKLNNESLVISLESLKDRKKVIDQYNAQVEAEAAQAQFGKGAIGAKGN